MKMAKDKKQEEKPVEKKGKDVEYASDGLKVSVNHSPDVEVKK